MHLLHSLVLFMKIYRLSSCINPTEKGYEQEDYVFSNYRIGSPYEQLIVLSIK